MLKCYVNVHCLWLVDSCPPLSLSLFQIWVRYGVVFVRSFVCFSSLFSLIKKGRCSCKVTFLLVFACVCVYRFFKLWNNRRIWRNLIWIYPFERSHSVLRFNYLRLVTRTWRIRELLRLELHFLRSWNDMCMSWENVRFCQGNFYVILFKTIKINMFLCT